MSNWTARVEWAQDGQPSVEQLDEWMDQLTPHHGVLSGGPAGDSWAAVISVEAGTLRQAIASALAVVEETVGAKADGVEVLREKVHTERLLQPSIPDLVGYAEIGTIAGVSRQRARQFHTDPAPGFPEPVVETGAGPLFLRARIETWAAQRNPGKGGRPRTVEV